MSNERKVAELLRNLPTNWNRWGPDDEIGSLNYSSFASSGS